MKKSAMILLMPVCFLAGCKTTGPSETVPVPWKQQQAFASRVKDPRYFGYSIYQTPAGIEYRGGCRLRPNQAKMLKMEVKEPLRPVVMLDGKFGEVSPVLLDFTSAWSWMEFDLAQSIRAVPVSERQAQLNNIPGEKIPGCLAVVPTLKLGNISIENPQVMVRMANGSLGSVGRGIENPEPKGVIGWEVLKKFEQIHLDYAGGRIALSTTQSEYTPNPFLLVAAIPLIQPLGVCAIRGVVDGQETWILIDPAGDFEVAADGTRAAKSVQLNAEFGFTDPVVSSSPGGVRIGARLLQKFKVTICPQAGMIYFEKPDARGE